VEAEFVKIRQLVAFLARDRFLANDLEAMRLWALRADLPTPLRALLPSHA
jgi:histidine ammonia-lyase